MNFISSSCCIAKDPNQIIGIGCKFGHLFNITSIRLPSHIAFTIHIIAYAILLTLSHACLVHTSIFCLQPLLSCGLLKTISNFSFNCMSCQLGKHTTFTFNKTIFATFLIFYLLYYNMYGASFIPIILRGWGLLF